MTETTQATLLDRLRDGADVLAWHEFFERYWRLIYAFARRRGCTEHTAEEIVQEVMLKVFRQHDVFRYDPTRGRFRDWLGTVVRNAVAECRRRPSERVRADGGLSGGDVRQRPTCDSTADTEWEAAFEQSLLMALLEIVRREINPREYLAFELTTFSELSAAEAARVTGLRRSAVYKARQKVVQRLTVLGQSYRRDGRLEQRVKEALRGFPNSAVERSVTSKVEATMCSR